MGSRNNKPGRIVKGTAKQPNLKDASGIWSLDEAMQAHRANAWPQPDLFQPVANSLRLSNAKDSSLQRVTTRDGNRYAWTYSIWFKKSTGLVSATWPELIRSLSPEDAVRIGASGSTNPDGIQIYFGGTTSGNYYSTAVLRDPSAWYHLVVSVDSRQTTNTNRVKAWLNGVALTLNVLTYLTQGYAGGATSANTQSIGSIPGDTASENWEGQVAEVNFIDGYQLDPSLFGKFDSNNTWIPVAYTGSYGTTGFYLPFNNATTSQTLGYDASLNGTATYDADQDPYRGSVALHLTGNGPAGGQNNTFADSGPNNLAVTRQGSVITQGSFGPFLFNTNAPYNPAVNGGSAWFNNTPGENLLVAASSVNAIGSGVFTLECWAWIKSSKSQVSGNGTHTIISQGNNASNLLWALQVLADGTGVTWGFTGSAVTATTPIPLNSWVHFSVTRDASNSEKIFVNGALVNTRSNTTNYNSVSSYQIQIGSSYDTNYPGAYGVNSYANTLWGYISSTRLIIGSAVYTAAFTPPNKPFGTLTNNLIGFSEDYSNSVWNKSSSTVTTGAAIAPDGNPSALAMYETAAVTAHAIWQNLASNSSIASYTWSAYVKANGRAWTIINAYCDGANKLTFFDLTNGVVGTNPSGSTASITNVGNGWYRCVVTRSVATAATIGLEVWSASADNTSSFLGDATKGLYIWGVQLEQTSSVGNYTPTPANYATAPSLLLNFANAAVVDSAGAGNIVTASGAAITGASKYGSGALAFNGSSDYYQSTWSLSPFLSPGTNNWTLETWVYMTKSLSSVQVIVNYGYESGTTRSFVWYYNGDGTFRLAQSPDGSTNYDAGFGAPQGGFALNTWYHLAIVRNSGAMTMYVNGRAMPNTMSAYTISSISTGVFRVGVDSSNYFGGYMDDVRLTKGVARYTSDFAPPARALPETGGKSFTTVNVNAGVVKSFTTTGTTSWTAPVDVTQVEILVVAGGGGSGGAGLRTSMTNTSAWAGGGGGGGVIYNSQYPVTPGQTYTVTVGAGGAVDTNGNNSVFGNLTAVGGGAGGDSSNGSIGDPGSAGGSGGGGGGDITTAGGAGTAGQGFAGGAGLDPSPESGGGGGGAGGVGSAGATGAGGNGLQFGISGTPTYYAGGGGGGAGTQTKSTNIGGLGGGGNGTTQPYTVATTATAGTANTGGGGGGGPTTGGSGIVIVRYTTTAVGNTSDATTDNLTDSPTQYGHDMGMGGEVVGNYATMNPLMGSTLPTFSNGNLTTTGNAGSSSFGCVYSSIAMTSGNWYAEVRLDVLGTNQTQLGVASYIYPRDNSNQNGLNSGLVLINFDNSLSAYRGVYQNGSVLTGGNVGMNFSAGDIIGVAFNATARTVAFYQNGVSLGSSSPYSVADVGTGQFYFVGLVGNLASTKLSWNFGQRAWAYAPPAGYNALTTKNFARPAVGSAAAAPNQFFDAVTYTGTGAAQTITLSGAFQPDLVWMKARSLADNHVLMDSVRGTSAAIFSDLTNAEVTNATRITSFNANGFTLGTSASVNTSSATYVAWAWKAGGTAVSNTDGTITSQVSANTTSGFSVVTYTGGATGATVGHGLGVTPAFVITKCRNTTQFWIVHHQSIAITSNLYLQTTDGAQADSQYTAKSSTTLTLGSNVSSVNTTGNTYVSYCWAEVAGFSKFGSYTGNGSTDGPFVYTGFKPRFVMVKRTNLAEVWAIIDTARDPYNASFKRLLPNSSSTENISDLNCMDILSNGFKLKSTDSTSNASGSTYIFMAIAEKPFGNVNGVAR
jgi:hypothetical protein